MKRRRTSTSSATNGPVRITTRADLLATRLPTTTTQHLAGATCTSTHWDSRIFLLHVHPGCSCYLCVCLCARARVWACGRVCVCPCLRTSLFRTALNRHAVGSERDLNVAPHALEHRHPSPQQLTHDHLRSGHRDRGGQATSGGVNWRETTIHQQNQNSKQTAIERREQLHTHTPLRENKMVVAPGMRAQVFIRVGNPTVARNREGVSPVPRVISMWTPSCVWRSQPPTG